MRNETRVRKILPVDLMLEGRRCLVVGGGTIAARKVGHLREAGACVTVVSPVLGPELQALAGQGAVEPLRRGFRDADVRGRFLVIAATDHSAVNGRVIALCRKRGILCASADAHWTDGDFLTPATLRKGGLVLTVATGGQSCRRARLVKDYLSRRIDRLGPAELVAVGGLWRTGRARHPRELELAVRLQELWRVYEFVIVDLSSRFELLAAVAREGGADRWLGRALDGLTGTRRTWRGIAAVRHAAGLAAGAHGAALRQALQAGVNAGWAGMMMRDWIEGVLRSAETTDKGVLPHGRLYESIIRGL